MTPEDRTEIQDIVATSEQRITAAVTAGMSTLGAALSAAFSAELSAGMSALSAAFSAAFSAAEERAVERARDLQTEVLRGLEAFARGNFARFHSVESNQTDINIRMAALEERVLYLETRRPPQ